MENIIIKYKIGGIHIFNYEVRWETYDDGAGN